MNISFAVRYTAELFMIVPAAAMAIIPVRKYLRFSSIMTYSLLSVMIAVYIVSGTVICTMFLLPTNYFLFPFMVLFLTAYLLCINLPLAKKLFCFFNSAMLCGFCTMYSVFVTAPLETEDTFEVFRLSSGLICLGISLLIIAAFFRTLAFKLPQLMKNESIDKIWRWLVVITMIMTFIVIWMMPINARNAMVGRLRKVSIVVLLLIPIVIWFMYHILWWVAKQMQETAELQQNYDILQMEEKQYKKTLQYLEETSTLRHDFRHHLLMIEEFARQGDTEKLLEYIKPFIDTTTAQRKKHFENPVLDAVASHYIDLAQAQDTLLLWNIQLPEKLPFRESDICSLLCNLLENSLKAVSELPKTKRTVHIGMHFPKENLFAMMIRNPFTGTIVFGKDNLPVAPTENHGIGMRSIKNTVDRYNGKMLAYVENGLFEVDIIMYTTKNSHFE